MGSEQKPVHHRLGRGRTKPFVIIGTVVVFFLVLSMTGLGHSRNHVERDMPAHAVLSRRRAGRNGLEIADGTHLRHRGRLHGAHDLRERLRAHDSATPRVGTGDRDGLFGHDVDDATEWTADSSVHEVTDPILDTPHDSAEGRHQHGLGDASSGGASRLSGAEREADAARGRDAGAADARDASVGAMTSSSDSATDPSNATDHASVSESSSGTADDALGGDDDASFGA